MICGACVEGLPHNLHFYQMDGLTVIVDEGEKMSAEIKEAESALRLLVEKINALCDTKMELIEELNALNGRCEKDGIVLQYAWVESRRGGPRVEYFGVKGNGNGH